MTALFSGISSKGSEHPNKRVRSILVLSNYQGIILHIPYKANNLETLMSSEDYQLSMLVNFLRQSTIEGLLNPAVAKSRLNAVENLQSEMTEDEKNDLKKIDVDKLCAQISLGHPNKKLDKSYSYN